MSFELIEATAWSSEHEVDEQGTVERIEGAGRMATQGSTKIDLSNIPLFSGIDPDVIGVGVEDWSYFYYDGQSICTEGEQVNSMIVILHGEVAIMFQDTFLVTRRSPDVVGEQGFLTGDTCRTATALARGTVQVLRIPRVEVERLQATSHQFTRNLLRIVSTKLAGATSERAFRYRNEHKLIAAFNSHLSPDITARLLASSGDYGQPRLIQGVVLFADVRGFTEKSLRMSPNELANQLGRYLEEMVTVLHEHDAFVDKFIGDAVMGVWGFPFEAESQASQAFACAKKMVARAALKDIDGCPVRIGVGLSAGQIFCGNIGSDLKRQFTVLGPAVNFAARCESACKELDASVVLSEELYAQLSEVEKQQMRVHPHILVKGIGRVPLYTISSNSPDADASVQ